ncbi:MAG: Hint domain-containing protein [Bergeyella sp.]
MFVDTDTQKVGVNTSKPIATLHVDGNGSPATLFVGPTPGCFIADTLVTMADGSQKNIQDIVVGDKLKAVDGVNTVQSLLRPILGDQPVYAVNGEEAFFTANHPFLTTDGWKSLDPETTKKEIPDLEVSLLQVGDILIKDGQQVAIRSIESQQASADTQLYNFALDGDHTYYANDYAVHNKIDCSVTDCTGLYGGTLYANDGTKRVGIGTRSPEYNLDVHGTSRVTSEFIVQGNNPNLILTPDEVIGELGGRVAATRAERSEGSEGIAREIGGIDDEILPRDPPIIVEPGEPCGIR